MPILKKIRDITKKLLSRLTKKQIVKCGIAAVFILLLLTMLPAAMPETNDEQTGGDLVFDEAMPDIDSVANPKVFPHLVIVYPEAEAWGEEEAKHIESVLYSRFHAHFVIISDSDYLALDTETLALYNSDPTLTVNLGISKLLDDSYLEVLSRLGRDGLEIRREGNRIDIVSASYTRVNEGAEAFIASIVFDGEFTISESLYLCDERPSEETNFAPDFISDTAFNILTVSYIDSNSYTLRALEGIIDHAKPDLVVFNGGVDGGAATRRDLAALWDSISSILSKTDTKWCFTPGELTGQLERITVCEVISSFDGCIRPIEGDESAAYAITVANSDGIVTASIYVGDTFDTCSALCDMIEADAVLYARASSYHRSVTAILPAVSKQIYASAEGIPEGYLSENLSDLCDSLFAADALSIICAADPAAPSIIEYSGGKLALCGSIGFDSRGLGGRFDYHHSIRGGVLLTLDIRRANYTENKLSYIYAAELGLTER